MSADELLLLPNAEQTGLGLLQWVGGHGVDLFKAVPERLRAKPLGREAPKGVENTLAIPLGDFRLWSRLADAMNGGEQKIVGRRRTGARSGPERGQGGESAGPLRGQPERAWEAESHRGGRERNRGGGALDQSGDALGRAEVGLMDDAGLAVDAGAFDDVIVERVGFLFGDERGHTG